MFLDKDDFERWMKLILEKLDELERKITNKPTVRHTVNGEILYDNQDLCFMLNVSKRTLQRFRSSGFLPYNRFYQKTYYRESDVKKFIETHLQKLNDKPGDKGEAL
jgi:hypothetical protein